MPEGERAGPLAGDLAQPDQVDDLVHAAPAIPLLDASASRWLRAAPPVDGLGLQQGADLARWAPGEAGRRSR